VAASGTACGPVAPSGRCETAGPGFAFRLRNIFGPGRRWGAGRETEQEKGRALEGCSDGCAEDGRNDAPPGRGREGLEGELTIPFLTAVLSPASGGGPRSSAIATGTEQSVVVKIYNRRRVGGPGSGSEAMGGRAEGRCSPRRPDDRDRGRAAPYSKGRGAKPLVEVPITSPRRVSAPRGTSRPSMARSP